MAPERALRPAGASIGFSALARAPLRTKLTRHSSPSTSHDPAGVRSSWGGRAGGGGAAMGEGEEGTGAARGVVVGAVGRGGVTAREVRPTRGAWWARGMARRQARARGARVVDGRVRAGRRAQWKERLSALLAPCFSLPRPTLAFHPPLPTFPHTPCEFTPSPCAPQEAPRLTLRSSAVPPPPPPRGAGARGPPGKERGRSARTRALSSDGPKSGPAPPRVHPISRHRPHSARLHAS